MVMSSKKIGRMVGADVDKALADIGASAPKPDMKADDELKKATGPSRNLTRGEAFKLARMKAKLEGKDPSKQVFEYEGKKYTTKMAGEGAKRSSTPTRRETPKPASGVSAATEAMFNRMKAKGIPKMEGYKADTQKKGDTPAKPKGSSYLSGVGGARSSAATAARKEGTAGKDGMFDRFSRWVHQTNLNQQERQKKKYGYAKGGKIDGIAIRGKTRAGKK
jgi:hypothetical protein